MTADLDTANALVNVLGNSRWDAVAMAKGFLAMRAGASLKDAARQARQVCNASLKQFEARLEAAQRGGLISQLTPRERLGSAENPVTKLFPAAVTEQRFIERVEGLQQTRPSLSVIDDRESGHTLCDFTLVESTWTLPINVKTAGTRFHNAKSLVGLDPDDCLPIPAYKAYAAIEKYGALLYVISADYVLVDQLSGFLPTVFTGDEAIAWRILNAFAGTLVRSAEDWFVQRTLEKHWEALSGAIADPPFVAISARKAVRVLTTNPGRTPGIGLRAWGTAASGEVNVHISVREEATPWLRIEERIAQGGLEAIVEAINRRKTEVVYDPEI